MNTRNYIRTLGFEPTELLGSGAYGEAWLLANGAVIKLTGSNAEEYCATRLFELQDTGAYSRFLPKLFEIGEAPKGVKFLPETRKRPGFFIGPSRPHFWYIRENLEEFPYPIEENFLDWQEWRDVLFAFHRELEHTISLAERDIERNTSLRIIDNKPNNWGLRTNPDRTQTLVLRDLACGDSQTWWDGVEQHTLPRRQL